MPPSNTRIAKAWSLHEMNRHFASLKAVDYGETQLTKSMKATIGYERLWFQFQQRDVQLGNFEVSSVFEDQDLESNGMTPYGKHGETFRDSTLSLAY